MLLNSESTALEAQVGEYLREGGLHLVTAESCTGGLLGDLLTNVPGSSDYYLGGFVSYANEAKQALLGVRDETLEQYGAVSAETALEMAHGARQAFAEMFPMEALIGISISGIAGPGGGTPEKPVGLVWVGISTADLEQAYTFTWHGTRQENKALSARQALHILLKYLRERVNV